MSSMTHKLVNLSDIQTARIPFLFPTALHGWSGFRNDNTNNQKLLLLSASGGFV